MAFPRPHEDVKSWLRDINDELVASKALFNKFHTKYDEAFTAFKKIKNGGDNTELLDTLNLPHTEILDNGTPTGEFTPNGTPYENDQLEEYQKFLARWKQIRKLAKAINDLMAATDYNDLSVNG